MRRALCYVMLAGMAASAYGQIPDPLPIVQEILLTDVLPVRHGDAALGDFDQDNDLDLLLTGARGGPSNPNPSTILYRSEGDTTLFVEVDSVLVEVDAVHMRVVPGAGIPNLWRSTANWGDFDGDSDLDVAIMGVDAQGNVVTAVYELLNTNGNFSPEYQSQTPVHSGDLIWADVDHDGDLDLTVCGVQESGEPLTTIYVNNTMQGTGFQPITDVLVDVAHCSLDLADFEIDGDMDFLITGTDDDGETLTRVYQNNGMGQFSRYPQAFEDLMFSSSAWGDYDADGYMDFIITGARFTPLIMEGDLELYRYDTTNVNFEHATHRIIGAFDGDPVIGRYLGGVAWGDLDNSGFMDFVVTGSESPRSFDATQIYLNHDVHYLEKSRADRFEGGFRGRAIIADYDSDRDLDLVVFGEKPGLPGEGARIRILRNNLIIAKRAPIAPESIDATVSGRSVTLNWTPGLDRQTPINGLSYNIRMGTSPGAGNVLPPLSNLSNGRRLVTGPGNVGTGRVWKLYNLSPGTYYWAIQALDQTFTPSPFSEEHTFTVE